MDPEDSFLDITLGLLVVAAVVSLVVRFRRCRGAERLQLKWFTYAGALLPLILLGDLLPDAVSSVLFAVGISLLPVAAGVAELLGVVDQTMQPTRASLWLRPERP